MDDISLFILQSAQGFSEEADGQLRTLEFNMLFCQGWPFRRSTDCGTTEIVAV